jgi:hypothetical protein
MGLNVTNVFIRTACDALADNMTNLEDKDREKLCDILVKLCEKYAPGTFGKAEKPKRKPKTRRDLSNMLDDMLDND